MRGVDADTGRRCVADPPAAARAREADRRRRQALRAAARTPSTTDEAPIAARLTLDGFVEEEIAAKIQELLPNGQATEKKRHCARCAL